MTKKAKPTAQNTSEPVKISAEEAAAIMAYLAEIPGIIGELEKERELLELGYSPVKGIAYDGIKIQSGKNSDSTQRLAVRAAGSGTGKRIKEIGKTVAVLKSDQDNIVRCIDGLRLAYKRILVSRYIDKDGWGTVGKKAGMPESTARNWHRKALLKLTVVIQALPDVDGLVNRAKNI